MKFGTDQQGWVGTRTPQIVKTWSKM